MTLNTAVIGAGYMGTRRAADAATVGRLSVVADSDGDRAAQLAAIYGARHTTHWQEALNNPEVDVVAVCTPNKFLAPISIAALHAGKHVLCEKPLGRNAAEAEQIAEAVRETNRVFKVGFTLRFHPAIRHAHDLCKSGAIGPVFCLNATYGHGGRPGYAHEWRGHPELAGGGELLDQGVHLIDLAQWFLGDLEVEAALTPTWYWNVTPLEDSAVVLLSGESGRIASLLTSWTIWKNRFTLEVGGRDGYIRVDGLGGSYGVETLTIGRKHAEGSVPAETIMSFDDSDSCWREDWNDLVSAIIERNRPEVDAKAGLRVMRLVDDVYSAARRLGGAPTGPIGR
jgi:predicted dehydrogenase